MTNDKEGKYNNKYDLVMRGLFALFFTDNPVSPKESTRCRLLQYTIVTVSLPVAVI